MEGRAFDRYVGETKSFESESANRRVLTIGLQRASQLRSRTKEGQDSKKSASLRSEKNAMREKGDAVPKERIVLLSGWIRSVWLESVG
jgi:hypothetical protein